jgi:hypothetical protein
MSVIKEIHDQPKGVRLTLFVLSCTVVLSLATYAWFLSFERQIFLAYNDDPEAEERLAKIQDRGPGLLAAIGEGLGSAVASIGGFIGFDRDEGFDIGTRNDNNHERTYLLPLSD